MRTVLRSADATPSTCFGLEDLRRWPPEHVAALQSSGVLEPTGFTTSIICPGCPEHCLVEVEFLEGQGSEPPRAYVICEERDDIGRVSIPLERLQQWRVSTPALGQVIATQLSAGSTVQERVPERLWWLGRVAAGEARGNVLLARGSDWDDAIAAFAHPEAFRGAPVSVVLTLSDAPAEETFAGRVKVVPLSRVVSIAGGDVKVAKRAITSAIGRAAAETAATADPVLVLRPKYHQALLHGDELRLPRRSFDLLLFLARQVVDRGGGWVPRDDIHDAVWTPGGEEPKVNSAQVDDTVRELRASFNEAETGSGKRLIDGERGLGYRLWLKPPEIAILPD